MRWSKWSLKGGKQFVLLLLPLSQLLFFTFLNNFFLIKMLNKKLQVNTMKDILWHEEQALCQIKVWAFAMNEPFSIHKSMAMTLGEAGVKFFFFWFFLMKFSLSPYFPPPLSIVLVSWNWMRPTGLCGWFSPFLHCTTVGIIQNVLCKAAIVWG